MENKEGARKAWESHWYALQCNTSLTLSKGEERGREGGREVWYVGQKEMS